MKVITSMISLYLFSTILVDTKSSYSKEGASNGDEAHDFPKVCFLDVFRVNLSTLLSKFIYGEQGY